VIRHKWSYTSHRQSASFFPILFVSSLSSCLRLPHVALHATLSPLVSPRTIFGPAMSSHDFFPQHHLSLFPVEFCPAPFISIARAPYSLSFQIIPETLALYYRARKDHRVLLFPHVSIYFPLISIQFSVGVLVRSVSRISCQSNKVFLQRPH
jgi:hypothetical protein